jgi:WD40 repeat protein/serine/threonine protein kinase
MPAPDSTPGGVCRIPDHELLRLIGRGSYGEVWLARNIMGTFRAVKIIRRDVFDSDSPFDREFAGIKKFEPISRTHSGFVDILQIGRNEAEKCLYYIMEAADDLEFGQAIDPDTYVPRTLGKALGRVKRFPVEQCVQMGLALCQALDTLHKHHLVHRDIKPSNIVFINGVPKLADIGLVTESENARSFVGTEGFIPPEGPGSRQADIFSLGKALYEIASGRDRLDFPALPSGLSEFPDADQFLELNECLIRACRLDPKMRYASAREMYEDLALLASGKSLRRLRLLERRWENAKRIAAGVGGVALISALVVWPLIRERQHADELRERQIGVRSANGISKLDQGDLPGALREFSEIYRLQAADETHFSVNRTRVAAIIANNPKLTDMVFLKGTAASVELSPDGKKILAVEKQKQAILLDRATGRELLAPIQSAYMRQASFNPAGDRAIVADEAGSAFFWDLTNGNTVRLEHPGNVNCARFSPDGKLFATACMDGVIRLWNATSLARVGELRGHSSSVRSVSFSHDGRFLVSSSRDSTARVWNVETGKPVGQPMRHPSWVGDAVFNFDSTIVVTAGVDGWARVWKVGSSEQLPSLMKHDDVVTSVGYSPDGTMILTASNDATVRLWDAATTLPLSRNHVLRHSAGVFSACFDSGGHQIITGCWDGTIRIWELAGAELQPHLVNGIVNDSGSMSAEIVSHSIHVKKFGSTTSPVVHNVEGEVRGVALSANGASLAAFLTLPDSTNATLRVWSTNHASSGVDIAAPIRTAHNLQFSPNGALLAVKGNSTQGVCTRVFDVASSAQIPLPASISPNPVVAFHPRTKGFAAGSGQTLNIFEDSTTPTRLAPIGVEGNIRHLAFSADGRQLLVCQADDQLTPKSAIIVDVESGTVSPTQFWHRDGVVYGAFSPNGGKIITGGEDRELLIWSAASPAEPLPPLTHRQQVRGLAFSSDGRWIGSVSSDGIARIWDSETGFPITPPLVCETNQSQIIFLPDRLRFATVQSPVRSWIWTLPNSNLSPDDAVALSHLLNADLRSTGPADTTQIAKSWSALKSKFPDLFKTDVDAALLWHTKQYRLAETRNLPFAMAFHSGRLNLLQPNPDDSSATLANKSK